MRTLQVLLIVFFFSFFSMAQMPSSLNLMPVPAIVQVGVGQLVVDQGFTAVSTGHRDDRLDLGIS
jgi:hypothetical protein